jgi:glycosyltransferase involved in cell wall biosynthesis
MKVALITGPCEPGRCGVGDYTAHLSQALQQAGVQVEIVSGGNWRLARLPSLLRLVRRIGADVAHLQYPTGGFGRKLGPQGLALALPGVVTIHEASNSHVLRRLSLYPFVLRAKHMIFTSNEERSFALCWVPWISERSSVIPIGSNIEGVCGGTRRNIHEIVYFGLVMPHKGLDDVLALAALFGRSGGGFRLRIVGSHRPEHAAYVNGLHRKSAGLPVLWEEDLSKSEVSRRLTAAQFAYFPFPDGASERRTTLKAALASGMTVVTRRGADTPRDLEPAVKFAASPSEAYAAIRELAANPGKAEELGNRARDYARRYSWEAIARSHLAVYERLAREPVTSPQREVEEHIIA